MYRTRLLCGSLFTYSWLVVVAVGLHFEAFKSGYRSWPRQDHSYTTSYCVRGHLGAFVSVGACLLVVSFFSFLFLSG
jgi:hypothetical protein